MHSIKAVIFDLDQTLIDSHNSHIISFKAVLGRHNVSITDEDVKEKFGKTGIEIISDILSEKGIDHFSAEDIRKMAEEKGKAVGVISLGRRDDIMYIRTLAVTNHNQSRGVGAQLIEFAKEFTRKKGLNTLRTYSFYEYKTVDFYLNQGFSLLEKPGIYRGHKYYRFEMEL